MVSNMGLNLLDWTGRQLRADERGAIPEELAPILERLQISDEQGWMQLIGQFSRLFRLAAGRPQSLQREREQRGCLAGPRMVGRESVPVKSPNGLQAVAFRICRRLTCLQVLAREPRASGTRTASAQSTPSEFASNFSSKPKTRMPPNRSALVGAFLAAGHDSSSMTTGPD